MIDARSDMKLLYFAFAFFAVPLLSNESQGQVFRAGIARVELDLPTGLDMWGYLPTRPSTGTLDPLTARVFYFEAGEDNVAVVTLDLGRTPNDAGMDRVRGIARERAGVDDVIFTSSHTHSGPYLLDEYPEGTPEWETAMLDSIAEGVVRAAESAFEAKLATGHGNVEIGHNRRMVLPGGEVKMLWANPTKIRTHPVDPEATLLRIDDARGNMRGLLVGYACHPVIFGPANDRYSADFPGAMSRYVRDRFAGDPVVAFVQGGCGNINPFMDKRRIEEDADRVKIEVGEELGREVYRVAKDLVSEAPADPSVKIAGERVPLRARYGEPVDYSAPVTVLVLNGAVGFIGLPGEPFVEFQLDFKRRADLDAEFFMGYTNGYLRYFPTIRAAAAGGYGASGSVAMTEVGAGEKLMIKAYKHLFTLLGRLSDRPTRR